MCYQEVGWLSDSVLVVIRMKLRRAHACKAKIAEVNDVVSAVIRKLAVAKDLASLQ